MDKIDKIFEKHFGEAIYEADYEEMFNSTEREFQKDIWKEAQKAAYTKIEDMFANEKSLDDIWRSTTDLKKELN